jgi:hypothetical protein
VSRFLAGDTHSYEKEEVDAVLWALQQYKPPGSTAAQAVQAAAAGGTAAAAGSADIMQQPLMVDVGANVGTFLFKVAEAGYRVAAFEGEGQYSGTVVSMAVRQCGTVVV